MLYQAAIEYEVVPTQIDESRYKIANRVAADVALDLASAKSLAVSSQWPDDWVIGCDSVVSVEGRMFDKPSTRNEAVEHLRFFSGKKMRLTSAVALACNSVLDWSHCETAELTVRELSGQFIEDYLDREWPAVGGCVGVFRMEGPGVQLFDSVEGNHFTILGMPLIPLLHALRKRGVLVS